MVARRIGTQPPLKFYRASQQLFKSAVIDVSIPAHREVPGMAVEARVGRVARA